MSVISDIILTKVKFDIDELRSTKKENHTTRPAQAVQALQLYQTLQIRVRTRPFVPVGIEQCKPRVSQAAWQIG